MSLLNLRPAIFQSKGEYKYHAFYMFMKSYMSILKQFFFGSFEVSGVENIPVGHPVIYSSNHQNAFMDALAAIAKHYDPSKDNLVACDRYR